MRKESIVWEKIEIPDEYASDTNVDENDALYYKIGYYVKKFFEEKNDEDTDVLLSYPVVYLHTWINKANSIECYFGETIDLLRRTKEHEEAGEDFRKWQSSWINGTKKISYYFSSKEMNKSMSLDLEDRLIDFVSDSLKKRGYNKITSNGRGNEQPFYSNKNKRNGLLKSIWTIIQDEEVFNCSDMVFDIDTYIASNIVKDDQCVSNAGDMLTLSDDNFLFLNDFAPNAVGVDTPSDDNCTGIDIILEKIESTSFRYKNWPVVYLHLWKDDEGLHIYTGEANEICKRTTEHVEEAKKQFDKIEKAKEQAKEEVKRLIENTEINEEEIKQAVEKHEMVKQAIADADWHMKWGKAIKNGDACVIVIGHEQFNKSITLDLENMLYKYTDKLDLMPNHTTKILVENGRGNEQKRYDNEDCLSSFFDNVVNYISKKCGNLSKWLTNKNVNNDVFKSLEYMRENAIFMASTLHKLSDKQLAAKCNILKKINEQSNGKRLLIIRGGWGTGKTVVASSLFFDLLNEKKNVYFIMNHDQLMDVYKNQAEARDCGNKTDNPNAIVNRILKASTAISLDNGLDIAIIDESHLLYEANNNGKGQQLGKLLEKTNTIVLLYDPDQHVEYVSMYDDINNVINTDEEIVKHFREHLENQLSYEDIDIEVVANLTQQFRMNCSDETIKWLVSLTKEADIKEFPFSTNNTKYKFNDFEDYNQILEYDSNGKLVFEIDIVKKKLLDKLDELILDKRKEYKSTCILSTYNYHYGEEKTVPRLFLKNNSEIYHGWHITGKDRVWFREDNKKETGEFVLAAARPKDCVRKKEKQSYYEVGAVQDIQGFDLDYAGVIIGESWKYDNNKVTIDISKVAGKNYQNNGDEFVGKKKKRSISNELGVLLSRGKKGLVIYAVNEKLSEKLFAVTKKK